ncbi:MAG: cation:proton antiporter [Alphaproteobacteria bacterium]|nr:cation:proton antiporter [Alphaproteobacteria bacterium]
MELFYVLLVLLVATRAFGELAERVGQPALVGELISGVVLGTAVGHYSDVFPVLATLQDSKVFGAITDLGLFFIMLFAGIEMQPRKILRYSGGALAVALGGMAVPLALGAGLGLAFLPDSALRTPQALFIGTALAVTAVPATVKILIDLKKLETPSGQIIVSAAVFDDVLSVVLLAWLTGMIGVGGALSPAALGWLGLKILAFFAVTTAVGLYAYPWGGRLLRHVREKELDLSAMLIAALAFAVLAEALDMHFILGAFVAGVFFGRKTIDAGTYDSVRSKVSGMTFGFLAPIFFASVGLNMDTGAFTEIPGFLALLVAAAFLGKVLGSGVAARLFGLSRADSLAVGVGMSARGAVELVIADIALRAGVFAAPGVDSPLLANLFSAVVIMAILTTLITPMLLKRVYALTADPG